MPRPARHESIPANIESVLGVDTETSPEQHTRITNPLQNPARPNALGIQFLTDLNDQRPTQTWMMITTPSLSTRLAPREMLTNVLGLMLDAHSESSKSKTDPLS